MSGKICILLLLSIFALGIDNAKADEAYSDSQLAGYIAGKIDTALGEASYPSKICTDDKGCVIVVY